MIEPKPHAVATDSFTSVKPDSGTVLRDVMAGDLRREVRVLDHGFVALVDAMPRLVGVEASSEAPPTADGAIVQAARVSYGVGTKKITEDRGLIRYLMRHRHTTPFEMVEFKFHCAMPIFIARQWIRHRTANINEYSGRYSIMPDRFYHPSLDAVRKQSKTNRQGGEEPIDGSTAAEFLAYLSKAEAVYREYLELTEKGVSREMARAGLPLSLYTEWYWKCDLHNILHFLKLRLDEHAQHEIREYGRAMYALIEPIVPITMEAFRDYMLESVQLTRLEIEAIREGRAEIDTANSREQAEWQQKRRMLGVSDD